MSLRVAIVGCGKIADGHAEQIQRISGAHLVAVCDLEPVMADQMAVRFAVPASYSDLDLMLREQRIDVLHVTTPPQSHLSITKKAVRAGCHVYMEKPIALTYEDTKELIDVVQRADRRLTVNYWPNFDPPGLQLRKIIDSKVLGEIIHVESFLGYNLSGAFGQALLADPEHWVHKLPGRLFQNNLDHVLNKIIPLLDERPEVTAFASRRRDAYRNNATDELFDELRVILRTSRTTAYATFSSHARPAGHFVRIYGTQNTVHADFNNRTVVLESEQTLPSALGRLVPPFKVANAYRRQARLNVKDFLHKRAQYFAGMYTLIDAFYRCVTAGGDVPIPYEHMLDVAWATEQINAAVYPVEVHA